jgi:uncharacterized Zn-binding protein involved in type VI secretion
MPPAARIGDWHECPMLTPAGPVEVPHVGGPVLPPGAVTVLIGGRPAARLSDRAECVGMPPLLDVVVGGSATVLVGGLPAARMGDGTAHGGKIVMGCFTVLIGG